MAEQGPTVQTDRQCIYPFTGPDGEDVYPIGTDGNAKARWRYLEKKAMLEDREGNERLV